MINVSAEYIQALKASARRLDAYFKLGDMEYHPLSFSIDNNVYSSENDSFIGTFIARSGKLKVNPADDLNLENQWLELYQGIMVSGSFQYKKLGSFLAYDKDDNNEYSIIDKKAVFNETAPVDEVTYPTTPLQLAQWVCGKVGISLATTTFPNDSLSIPEAISFGEQPVYADIIVAIAQASCTFARITSDDQLDFRWFSTSDFTIEQKNLAESWPETADPYGPINSLVLAREPLNDNVYIQDEESIEENGLTELKIANNPILDIDRHISKNAIFDRIDGFTYTPVKCKSQGFFIIEPGDIIQVQLKNQSYVTMYVMNHSISYSGSSRSSFETPALTKSQIQYQYAESVKQILKRTEAIVDKQEQRIQLIIETQDDQAERMTSIEMEQGQISQKVEDIEATKMYRLVIVSDNGSVFKNGSIDTNLRAIVYSWDDDVTDQLDDNQFIWTRVSADEESDQAWNSAHAGGTKSIHVTAEDVYVRATFYCDLIDTTTRMSLL